MNGKSPTERLREKLDELGVEYEAWDSGSRPITIWHADGRTYEFEEYRLINDAMPLNHRDYDGHCTFGVLCHESTPEQAIVSMLGDRDYERKMDALLCRLTNGKFSKSRQYDLDFMESCVNEEFEQLYAEELADAMLGHRNLTAEQVREAVMSADRWEKPMGNTGLTNTHLIIRDDGWQAIADELNATLGSDDYKQAADYWKRMYEESFAEPGSRTCKVESVKFHRWGGEGCVNSVESSRYAADGVPRMLGINADALRDGVEEHMDEIRGLLGGGAL